MDRETLSRILAATAFMAVLSFFWSTQITAGWLGNDPRLGGWSPFGLSGTPIYRPWLVYHWALTAAAWPSELVLGMLWNFASAAIAIAGGGYAVYLHTFTTPPKFGESGWGTMADAEGARLIAGKGDAPKNSRESRVIGEFEGKILTVTDERSGIVFGPPGGGKTRGVFIPSMLDWLESAISYSSGAQDVWEATAGWRATFSDVYFLDLGNPNGHRYNPLDGIRIGTDYEVRDALIMAELFPPQAPEDAKVPWWPIGGSQLMAALILHICYTKPRNLRNFGGMYRFVSMPNETIIRELRSSPNTFAADVGNGLEKQQEFIDSVRSYLRPWASPILAKVTSESDFKPSDIVANERPLSLYIRVPSDESASLMDALRVIISSLIRPMMHNEFKTSDGRTKRHTLLCPFDEFHKFKIRDFGSTIQEARKYGLRFLLGTPSEKSLYEVYGRNQAISESCHIQLYMATNDQDTIKSILQRIDKVTEYRTHTSKASEADDIFSKHTRSTVESTREIIDAGGIRSLPENEMLLFPSSHKVMKINKLIRFDEHPYFKSRILPAPPRDIERRLAVPALPENELFGASI